jgi:hypothetical protein
MLNGLSQRAIIAFVNATAEWIVYRLEIFTDTTAPHQYLEAAWAQVADWRYGAFTWEEYALNDAWTGPVRGPIGIAMIRVLHAVDQTKENGYPELAAAWITNLATHVMPDPASYLKWRSEVMKRLETLYPRNLLDTLGDVVPRQAVDPGFAFQPEHTESLFNEFLARLDYRKNPFLNNPNKMLQDGFEGTPYVFDLERDRLRRKVA